MSLSYWIIQGVGIPASEVYPHLNKRKLINFLSKQLPDDEEVLEWKRKRDVSEFDIDDFLYGEPFENLADLLTHCDDTDSITYGDTGDGEAFFYYPPSMPWHHTETEPKTLEEVHQRIVDAVMVVTDLSAEEIESMINDDIYEVGCG